MISVVIPLYNKENTILNTLNSILIQSSPEYEVVVVDDGSTDKSSEIVETVNDSRVRLIRQANGGPSAARNRGVREARYPWVVFLDADDVFESNSLVHFANLIENYPGIQCFACNFYRVFGGKPILYSADYKDGIIEDNFKEWFFQRLMPCQGSTIYRKELLLKYAYDESIRRYEDAQVLFSIFRQERIYRSSQPTFRYMLSENEASQPRSSINQDYLGHLSISEGASLWEKMVIYELYREALLFYPQECSKIYKKPLVGSCIVSIYYFCKIIRFFKRMINRLI